MKFPRVSIIILNWNGWKDTIECLESLYRITYPNYDVIVVDNGSKDDSIQKIKEYAEGKIRVDSKFFEYNPANKPIKVFGISEDEAKQGKFNRAVYEKLDVDRRMILIKNKDNYGFAGGNNVGIKFALSVLNPDYVLLLNNDTVVDKRFLGELVKVAESNEKIGIVGPKIYYYDYNGRSDIINFAGEHFILPLAIGIKYGNKKKDNNAFNKVKNVNKIDGACMLIKNSVISNVGLLDERYFLYLEDNDYCIRSKRAGFILLYVPSAIIWHKVSASTRGLQGKVSLTTFYYLVRNRFLLTRKFSLIHWICYIVFFFIIDFWLKIGFLYKNAGLSTKFLILLYKAVLDGVFGINGER
ncbi:glycosyltransferase family 2 protein [Pyrococcus kukulkanii]|uniref:glycosyltransferase family 2 protein n=1 Tax=Pyrococcus kukulkanii TaxID=1609559 RepID=UPI00356542F1